MPFLYFGFFVMLTVWLFWAVAWFVVWAAVMLAWPIALVLGAIFVLRALFKRPRRERAKAFAGAYSTARPAATRNEDAETNSAFAEYREQTLRKLDEEQGKFREFLGRLRKSRDKQEFESYMAARRSRPPMIEGEATRA